MPEENNKPQAIYTKNLPQSGGVAGGASSPQGAGIPQVDSKNPDKKSSKKMFGTNPKAIMAILGLGLFFMVAMAGVLISQKQRIDKTATAPSAPASQPSADIVKPTTCNLTFLVSEPSISPTATPTRNPSASPTPTRNPSLSPTPTPSPTPAPGQCGSEGCLSTSDCNRGLVCVTANNGGSYCSQPIYKNACITNASSDDAQTYCCSAPTATPTPPASPTPTRNPSLSPTPTVDPSITPSPTPTPAPSQCGYEGCTNSDDCSGNLICVSGNDNNRFCAMPEYAENCAINATSGDASQYCCVSPTSPIVQSTNTPAPNVTSPPTTTVITTVSCNDTCSVNADCTNISHICYNGLCRLDSNPENEACQTPSGGTTVAVAQPTLPPELPVSGFEGLAKYFKVGLGALGAGLLLLLFL